MSIVTHSIRQYVLCCRQPVLGQRSRPRPPPAGYKHLSPEQRSKLDVALAQSAEAEADAAEGVRTEVHRQIPQDSQ